MGVSAIPRNSIQSGLYPKIPVHVSIQGVRDKIVRNLDLFRIGMKSRLVSGFKPITILWGSPRCVQLEAMPCRSPRIIELAKRRPT